MTLHDPIAGPGNRRAWRFRWLGRLRGPDRAASQRPGPGARAGEPYRRKLASIERRLATDAPALSSKFTMFNRLTAGELAAGAEPLPPPARPRPRPLHLAVLLVLAAIVALCIVVSVHVGPAVRSCRAVAAAGTSAYVPVRGLTCDAYANTRQ
jgi:hypothetical protein